MKDWYTHPGVEIVAPPVVFQEAGKDIVAVTTKDGRILLLDAASLGGANHVTPMFASTSLTGGAATFAAYASAMWQERTAAPSEVTGAPEASSTAPPASGARWLLIPVTGVLPASLGAAGNGAVSSGAVHFPMSWIRRHGKGRVFYTGLGHGADVFANAQMLPGRHSVRTRRSRGKRRARWHT